MNIELNQAQSFANRLVDLELQRVVVGPSSGSIIGLYFNVPQTVVDARPWYLGISCSWRVEDATGLVACSTDENAAGGAMQTGLEKLLGGLVKLVTIEAPAFDLVLLFERGQRLIAFADNLELGRLCWYVSDPEERAVSVEPAGHLCYEEPISASATSRRDGKA